jgi:glycosyltransferase involved in cell wall biosynthesis
MNKIKVLQIISSSNIGGAEKMFYELLKYLDKDKFEIYVACPPDGLMAEDFKKFSEEVNVVDFNGLAASVKTIFLLKKYMKQKQIDVVHTHLFSADFAGIIAAKLASVPYKISTIYGYNFRATGQFNLRNIKNYICSFIYKAIYVYCDRITAVSAAVKEDLSSRGWVRVKEQKIEIIYSAVDFEETVKCSENVGKEYDGIFSDNGQKYIGMMANFDRVKGHRVLLKAIPGILKKMPNVKFLLTGNGEDREYIKKRAEKLKIQDNVIFLGVLENAARIISKCDLIVLPSLSEGLPMIIIEAMLFGKPVIASNVGGIPELIKNNENGILVSPNSDKELSEAVVAVLKDDNRSYLLGQRGKNMIYGEFGDKFRAQKMTKEIERLLCLKTKI